MGKKLLIFAVILLIVVVLVMPPNWLHLTSERSIPQAFTTLRTTTHHGGELGICPSFAIIEAEASPGPVSRMQRKIVDEFEQRLRKNALAITFNQGEGWMGWQASVYRCSTAADLMRCKPEMLVYVKLKKWERSPWPLSKSYKAELSITAGDVSYWRRVAKLRGSGADGIDPLLLAGLPKPRKRCLEYNFGTTVTCFGDINGICSGEYIDSRVASHMGWTAKQSIGDKVAEAASKYVNRSL